MLDVPGHLKKIDDKGLSLFRVLIWCQYVVTSPISDFGVQLWETVNNFHTYRRKSLTYKQITSETINLVQGLRATTAQKITFPFA